VLCDNQTVRSLVQSGRLNSAVGLVDFMFSNARNREKMLAAVLSPSFSEKRRSVSGYLLRCDLESVEIRRCECVLVCLLSVGLGGRNEVAELEGGEESIGVEQSKGAVVIHRTERPIGCQR
jgi:hypothetical protein